jgi:hypothetical protein
MSKPIPPIPTLSPVNVAAVLIPKPSVSPPITPPLLALVVLVSMAMVFAIRIVIVSLKKQ